MEEKSTPSPSSFFGINHFVDLKASSEGVDVSQKWGWGGGGHDHEAEEGKLSGGVLLPPPPWKGTFFNPTDLPESFLAFQV